MGETRSLRAILGVGQEDLALILNVSRSQLAMYETGRRDLPIDAKMRLAEMLKHAKENTKKIQEEKGEEDEIRKTLEELLLVNRHRQLITERKIRALERKLDTHSAKLKTIHFLQSQPTRKDGKHHLLLEHMASKAAKEKQVGGISIQIQLEIKKEVLQAEEKILNRYLKNI